MKWNHPVDETLCTRHAPVETEVDVSEHFFAKGSVNPLSQLLQTFATHSISVIDSLLLDSISICYLYIQPTEFINSLDSCVKLLRSHNTIWV